jgi:hydrogenase maturation factor HypE
VFGGSRARWDTQPVRPIYPSRAATVLFIVSVSVLMAGFVIIFAGDPVIGRLIGAVGVIGAVGSVWVNHKRAPG